jgi:Cdc6-like AAA superfamily ATPase
VSAIGNRRRLAPALRQQAITDLRARFPHCGGVLESVARHSALLALCPTAGARQPPILLLGKGGVGKTALVRAIANALGSPIVEIAMGAVSRLRVGGTRCRLFGGQAGARVRDTGAG